MFFYHLAVLVLCMIDTVYPAFHDSESSSGSLNSRLARLFRPRSAGRLEALRHLRDSSASDSDEDVLHPHPPPLSLTNVRPPSRQGSISFNKFLETPASAEQPRTPAAMSQPKSPTLDLSKSVSDQQVQTPPKRPTTPQRYSRGGKAIPEESGEHREGHTQTEVRRTETLRSFTN